MSDISTHYGGSILAMVGKDSVSIVTDQRLGAGFITVSKDFIRTFQITPKCYVGLSEFIPDCQFLLKKVKKQASLFKLEEGRDMEPHELAAFISYFLYSRRGSPLYTSPVIIGLDSKNKPYVCGMDCIGAKSEPESFIATGTASENLMGMCEALWREEMDPEDLFTTSVQAFLNSIDRDCLSGWGAECVIITPDEHIKRKVKGRCD
ncbi:20S proteasome subunit beta 3 [Enteropsectra breve]|nr:20S proteasome subunit beta 3 [Enteropsectra breve]